ncbi:MAG: hypothetical protein RIS20_1835 [Bacteroidota bacterium]|jgi:hypothetical protein
MSASNYQQWLKDQSFTKFKQGDFFVFLGSCFSDELGAVIRSNGFNSLVNPGGTIFHPLAIAKLIEWTFDDSLSLRVLKQEDIFFSWELSGSVYGMSSEELALKIEKLRLDLRKYLRKANQLFVTFGSAWAYRLKSDGAIVANCHKQSSQLFQKENSSVEEIVTRWKSVISLLKKENPSIAIFFTVSPVRHIKDGYIENNRSKARLLLAVEELQEESGVFYFPAYEFVMDELRDFRYFKADGVHPTQEAVLELWDFFQSSFFSDDTIDMLLQWQLIRQAEQHKILYPKSQAARRHMEQTMKRKAQFLSAHPLFHLP